jgi:hypothetical protein
VTLTAAWLSSVSSISRTEPIRRPPTCTSSSRTSWPAFWNSRVYSVPPSPRKSSSQTTNATASASAPAAAILATVTSDAPSSDRYWLGSPENKGEPYRGPGRLVTDGYSMPSGP